VDGIQVGHVPDHVVVQQDAVAAEHGQRRSELNRALLVARAGDQLVVTKLDRLGRSLEHLIDLSKGLQPRGVDLVVLHQGIDTSTAVGRMFFQILGAIAEFEHALMSERTMDGLGTAVPVAAPAGRSPSSPRARRGSRRRCTKRPVRTASVATPWDRSPPSSALPDPPSTGTLNV
jgi:DNA invertase Pin-like site-specific DNA recombinase